MANALFMNPAVLKDNYVVDSNVDERIIRSCIENAQRFYIERYIGTALYEKLNNAIVSNTLNANETNLLDNYIIPALKHYSTAELFNYLAYRATQKGIIQKQADRSDAVDNDTLFKLRDEEISKGDYFGDRLYKYLCSNSALFPEFSQNNQLHELKPKGGFNTDVYLGEKNCFNDNNYHCC